MDGRDVRLASRSFGVDGFSDSESFTALQWLTYDSSTQLVTSSESNVHIYLVQSRTALFIFQGA